MGKSVTVKKHFTFVGGLNTEAGPLTFPPNTWADGDNVVPDADGSLSLRTAIDYETSYSLSTVSKSSSDAASGAYVVGEWNAVGGNGNSHFLVVQQGITVSFYVNAQSPISGQLKAFSIDLTTYKAASNFEADGVAPIECTSANGKLIIVSRDTDPILVTYDAANDTISVAEISMQIRDFIGVDDGLDIDERINTLSDAHNYNLRNQGWLAAHITTYFGGAAVYPSNAQQWTAGKDATDTFSQALLDKQDFGTSPAPKGRYVLDLFSRNRTAASGVANITTETETYRPTTCAFWAGRAWYAGVRSNTIATWVMFSQVAETSGKLGKCYQDADPTSEVVSDLVATDGGVVPIQDAGAVIRLIPFRNSMLVICDNGIWQIIGGLDSGFSASSYEVRRLSSVGCVSPRSVVFTEKGVMFWSEDGIYNISANEVGGTSVAPVSLQTVQSLYNDIPMLGKFYSAGVFDPTDRIVYWLYNDSADQDGLNWRYKKNRLLCLDISVPAFYTMTVEELAILSPWVLDAFVTRARSASGEAVQVTESDGDTVLDGSGNNVVTTQSGSSGVFVSPLKVKFLALHPASESTYYVTIANFDEDHDAPRKFRDWYSKDNAGSALSGYIIPGYDMGGEGQGGDKYMQALYVSVFMRRTETGVDSNGDAINPSSCSMRARWDWTDSASSNRWSAVQEVYRHVRPWQPAVPSSTFDDGHPVVVTKNKVRGKGRALQLHFASTDDKDMQILGWAITYVGNANV